MQALCCTRENCGIWHRCLLSAWQPTIGGVCRAAECPLPPGPAARPAARARWQSCACTPGHCGVQAIRCTLVCEIAQMLQLAGPQLPQAAAGHSPGPQHPKESLPQSLKRGRGAMIPPPS